MKNILLLLIGFTIAIDTIAQPTLTAANGNPVVGDQFYGHDQADTTGISKGASGAGVTWNLAFLDTTTTDTTLYLSCASTPYCDSFPGSTLAVYGGSGDYSYFIADATQFAISGVGEPDTGGGGCVYYPVPQSFFNFPNTYGSVYADSFYSDQPLGDYFSYGIDSFISDAYGTLILPSGTYHNALRVHLISYETDIFYLTSPVDTIYDTIASRAETYFWFDTGFHNPLLIMSYDTSGALTYLSDAEYYSKGPDSIPHVDTVSGIARIANESALQLYPNPASDYLHIKFTSAFDQRIAVSTIDMIGRVVIQNRAVNVKEGMNDVSYNVAHLPPGLYFIKIQTAGNAYMEKVEIER